MSLSDFMAAMDSDDAGEKALVSIARKAKKKEIQKAVKARMATCTTVTAWSLTYSFDKNPED